MGANSIVSAQPALPSDSLWLPQRLRRASAKRERTQQADPNAEKVEQKKGGQNCAAYAALRRGEDGPARGRGQGDFSRNCGWAVQVRGADGPEHQAKQEGHLKAGRHSTGQPQVESPGGISGGVRPFFCPTSSRFFFLLLMFVFVNVCARFSVSSTAVTTAVQLYK